MLLSRSKRAPAIAVSSSEGFCLDGELMAILLIAAMIADERRVAGCAADAAFCREVGCRGWWLNGDLSNVLQFALGSAVGSEARPLA